MGLSEAGSSLFYDLIFFRALILGSGREWLHRRFVMQAAAQCGVAALLSDK
jgi:hypothetical protein